MAKGQLNEADMNAILFKCQQVGLHRLKLKHGQKHDGEIPRDQASGRKVLNIEDDFED